MYYTCQLGPAVFEKCSSKLTCFFVWNTVVKMATFNSSEPDSAVQISSNGAEQLHDYQGRPKFWIVFFVKKKVFNFLFYDFTYFSWAEETSPYFLIWSKKLMYHDLSTEKVFWKKDFLSFKKFELLNNKLLWLKYSLQITKFGYKYKLGLIRQCLLFVYHCIRFHLRTCYLRTKGVCFFL